MPTATERTRRLEWRHGQWSLQINELVQVERDYYRPRQRRIDGVEAIRGHLSRHGEDRLARGLSAVVSDPSHEGIGFDAIDGTWVPDRSATMLSTPARGPDLTARVSALNAEIVLLKATVWGLTERLAALERRVTQGVPAARANSAARSVPEEERDPAEALIADTRDVSFREAPVAPTPRPQQPAPAARNMPEEDDGDDDDDDDAPPAEPEFAELELPPVSDLLQCLKVLLGADPGAKSTKTRLPETPEGIAQLYVCRLLDDDGQERGALVTDLRAAYDLGGSLMGWTPEAIEQQFATGKLDTEAGEGMSEVMNNLSGVVNRVGRVHTRSAPLKSLAEQPMTWLSTQSKSRGILTKSKGYIWLVTR